MRPFHTLIVALPVLASIVVAPLAPAEARGRHDGGAAVIAGLLGLGIGAVAGSALGSRSYGYEQPYAPQAYAPVYAAPPPVYYAPPPRIVYAPPPPIAYAPPGYYVERPVYFRHRYGYEGRRRVEADWGDDD